jgi:predicted metallo-beta-lactamase superfamily hydrolase
MSEQKQGFMQQLDSWTETEVIKPAIAAWREYQDLLDQLPEEEAKAGFRTATAEVKKAVREKVLESYRNGQQAGPRRQNTKQK